MARFVVHIKNLQTGKSETRRFERSPVLVGRHPRNDLPLEFPFVSQWHGSFRFDEDGRAYYVDQGSTNGSYLDGKRLVSAHEKEIFESSDLRIGVLRLRLERDHAPEEAEAGPSRSRPAWRTSEFGAPDRSDRDSLPDTRPEIGAPGGDLGPADGAAGWGATAMDDTEGLGRLRKDWRRMLPRAGSAPAEDLVERLSRALELLGLIVERQATRDAQLASALESLRRQGGDAAGASNGEVLLAYLLDPEAPVGERADELRARI